MLIHKNKFIFKVRTTHRWCFYSQFGVSTINSEHKVTSWVQQMSLVQLQHSTMLWRNCPANQLLQLNLLLASVFQFICFGDKSVLICVRSSRHIRCTCVT